MLFTLSICFLLAISPGCVTNAPSDGNLTIDELADRYLAHAATIMDYHSVISSTDPGNRFRTTFDYKKPSSMRSEYQESLSPGSFGISNGTLTVWYDAESRTYYYQGNDAYRDVDYQSIVREIVAKRNFAIVDRDIVQGVPRYLIEEGNFTTSGTRAWIEPSTGLTWNYMTYLNCSMAGMDEECSWSGEPISEIRYASIEVNTGIPDSYFNFIPPVESKSECYRHPVIFTEPKGTDTSVPIDQPLSGGISYSLNEHDSGRTITLQPGDVVEITLMTIPGLAYHWIMSDESNENESPVLELLNAGTINAIPENHEIPGEKSYYRWRYRAVSPGNDTLKGRPVLNGCHIHGGGSFDVVVQVS